ncbi:hypothetical protein MAUB1S_03440 [Mycolicibacterium aubagnense]
MSMIRSAAVLGASAIGAGAIALVCAAAASADTGINITPGNNGRSTAVRQTPVSPTICSAPAC